MSNSRMVIKCKHCGDSIVIATGNAGQYFIKATEKQIQDFFNTHKQAICTGDINCSEDARQHFEIDEIY